ncbi:hypothetical protein [Acidovorax sp. LjRoot117]|uniref:hypothetical protein n=1 Tax=Acidovorax sp. LjRoot117 TaxID=3342255 RepID=UPI003ECE90C0
MIPTLEAIKANCDEVGDCWEWRGALDGKAPLMRISITRRLVPVRRWILEQAGKMKDGCLACAKCDNPRCVAPDHAVALTRQQLQTRTAKTTRYGSSIARKQKLAIARRARETVLTLEKVQEMRASGLTTRQAAKVYGCGQTAAADAMAGRTWRDYSSPFAALGQM